MLAADDDAIEISVDVDVDVGVGVGVDVVINVGAVAVVLSGAASLPKTAALPLLPDAGAAAAFAALPCATATPFLHGIGREWLSAH